MILSLKEMDDYDKLLANFQPDLRFIVRKYRKNFHPLSEEEIVSEVNRRLIVYKDNYISNNDAVSNEKGFKSFAYSCARNAVFWTAKGISDKEVDRKRLITFFSFLEEKDSDLDMEMSLQKKALNAAKEESFLDTLYPSTKIKNILKWITEYSDFLNEKEIKIFKDRLSGKCQSEIASSLGVTHQMVSLIEIKIAEKIRENIKVQINADNSLSKIKKGLKAVNHLFK